MHDSGSLLDAFAEVRRTWDDLVNVQPDIVVPMNTRSGSKGITSVKLSAESDDGSMNATATRVSVATVFIRASRGATSFDCAKTRPVCDCQRPASMTNVGYVGSRCPLVSEGRCLSGGISGQGDFMVTRPQFIQALNSTC